MRVHNEKHIKVGISGSKARLQFVCLAQQKKAGDHYQSKEEQTRHQTAPNAPHTARGCIAQAWSVAELLRAAAEIVYRKESVSHAVGAS